MDGILAITLAETAIHDDPPVDPMAVIDRIRGC
jgi:hypothetical protein